MRACMMALTFAMGALAMSDTATADDKKQPKKDEPKELKEGGFTYTERVEIKVWQERQKEFLNPVKAVWAFRRDTKDGLLFGIRAVNGSMIPTKGSHITDSEGNVFEITDAPAKYACMVKLIKKADPKKEPTKKP